MRTSSCLTILYLTSISILMCGKNFISGGCRVLLLKLFEDIKINWIVYVANLFTVIYIVSFAIKEYERNPQEASQDTSSSSELNEDNKSQPKVHIVTLANLKKADDASCDESCINSDEADSGISATVSKEASKTEVKESCNSKDESEWELGHQELVSRIKEILLEAREGKTGSSDNENELSRGESLLQVTPLSSDEDVYYTPKQNESVNQIGIINLSESSDDELFACQLDTIDEESSWKSDSLRSQNESQNVQLQLKDGDKCETNQHLTSPTKDHLLSAEPAERNGNASLCSLCKNDLQLHLDEDEDEDDELKTPPQYMFSEPYNLWVSKKKPSTMEEFTSDGHSKPVENVGEMHGNHREKHKAEAVEEDDEERQEERKEEEYQCEMPTDAQDDSLDQNFYITNSFSEVISKLSPGLFYTGNLPNESGTDIMSPSINLSTNDSIFNTTFSVSSLEDMNSPEVQHRVPTASPNRMSIDQSLDECNSRFLGIRLHKPAGIKDILLSIVSIDDEKGFDTVSDMWTLGNREDMELILSIDDTVRQSHKHYVGRYSLVFNDIKDNTLEDATAMTSCENSFLHSFLKDNNSESYVAESVSEDNVSQLSISRFGRLVWKAARAPQEARDCPRDEQLDVNTSEDEFNEASHIEEACSEVFENVHNASWEIAGRVYEVSRYWFNDQQNLRNATMAAGCVALTCFVVYRAW